MKFALKMFFMINVVVTVSTLIASCLTPDALLLKDVGYIYLTGNLGVCFGLFAVKKGW